MLLASATNQILKYFIVYSKIFSQKLND